jgi:hypothetical protein
MPGGEFIAPGAIPGERTGGRRNPIPARAAGLLIVSNENMNFP